MARSDVRSVARRAAGLAACALSLSLLAGSASAQDPRQNQPGQFDFYVLSLSWSPTFCAASAERAPDAPLPPECAGRVSPFVVLGLWPQYEQGFPEFCQQPAPRLDRNAVSSMLDLMPAPRLIFNEWDRHGTCSGLTAHAYFETVRKARAMIKIPDPYLAPTHEITATPAEIADAFVKANPGLTHASMALGCDAKRLTEVRICVNKDLHFHDCAEVEQRTCKREQLSMPAPSGERAAQATPVKATPAKATPVKATP